MPNTREKLIELLTAYFGVDPAYYGIEAQHLADHLIANGVTIPVRCKDCKHCHKWAKWNGGRYFACMRIPSEAHDVDPYHFCSYGERKTNISDSTKNALETMGRKAHGEV